MTSKIHQELKHPRGQRDQQRKSRDEHVIATTADVVSSTCISYDLIMDTLRFETPVKNTYFQSSYERGKGPKVLNRIALSSDDIDFNTATALLRNYDVLVALDTNTRELAGRAISMTGAVVGRAIATEN